ncbi:hypothetical protein J2Z21_008403 [Streptomyces griseochromogenes]|uniref:Uncharacterized protein n=1 Tax=Streptomyces griseochromogenes TaxID=68214 RepID=A0ABS4M6U9_9ACTN|nr:hypothetical protein [Streptomyces griseochromogenes]MBP2055389.1 hypothetical protein [Streptomyces griseochromogenes]
MPSHVLECRELQHLGTRSETVKPLELEMREIRRSKPARGSELLKEVKRRRFAAGRQSRVELGDETPDRLYYAP